jgi:hypothetical protein
VVVYSEVQFPIVELRVALERWLKAREDSLDDFEFESMESDETGLVWFRRQPSGKWRVGSVHQDELAVDELDLDDVVRGCERFVTGVDDWVRARLRLEIRNVVDV